MGVFSLSFLVILLVGATDGAGENDNVHEFGILCKIYYLTKQKVENGIGGEPSSGAAMVREIRVIAAVAAPEENATGEGQIHSPDGLKTKLEKLPRKAEREPLGKKLRSILKKASRLSNLINESHSSVNSASGRATEALLDAVFGTGASKITGIESAMEHNKQVVFGSEKDTDGNKNCGGDGTSPDHGKYVGVSLVNDFICLCVGKHNTPDKHCANTILRQAGQQDPLAQNQLADSAGKWDAIKKACPKSTQRLSPEAIEAALASFHGALGRQPKTGATDPHEASPYILGKDGDNSHTCDTDENKVCVNYRARFKQEAGGIPWETSLRKAQKELQTIQSERTKQERLLEQLQTLSEEARDAYDEAWEQSKISNPTERLMARNQTISERREYIQKPGSSDPQTIASKVGAKINGQHEIIAVLSYLLA